MGLYFSDAGPRDAPALLFLHGFLGSSQDWQPVIDRLKDRYRCLAIDLPGHGRSIHLSPASYTFPVLVNEMLTLAWPAQIILIGYSMGGRVALALAAQAPQRFKAVFIESASLGLANLVEKTQRLHHDRLLAQKLLQDGLENFLTFWYNQPLFTSLKKRLESNSDFLNKRRSGQAAELAKALEGLSVGNQEDLRERIHAFQGPMAYLAGKLDSKYVREGESLQSRHSSCTFFPVEGVGHNIHEEDLDSYFHILESFLSFTAHPMHRGSPGMSSKR